MIAEVTPRLVRHQAMATAEGVVSNCAAITLTASTISKLRSVNTPKCDLPQHGR